MTTAKPYISSGLKCSAVLMTVSLLGRVPRAQAGAVYSFGHISDTSVAYPPAINNNGTVAFVGNGGTVFTGNGGTLTPIGTGTGAVYGVWINDSGQVAFRNNPSLGVFNAVRGSGGPVTVIGPVIGVMPVISNDGTVTFLNGTHSVSGGFGSVGIFSGSGGALTTVMPTSGSNAAQYTSEFEALAVSHNGTLAFEKYPSAGATNGQQIIISRSGVQTVALTLPTSGISGIESIAVNNSGLVAVTGFLASDDRFGVYLTDGTTITKPVSSNSDFSVYGPASINNLGAFAFYGESNGHTFSTIFDGLYTGSDPLHDKIIQTGDPLNGSTVTQLVFGTDAYNDNGEAVFWAKLADGTSGVYTASPVPEPTSLAALLVGVSGLLMRRRRDV